MAIARLDAVGTAALSDCEDSDGDGINNWPEWIGSKDPTADVAFLRHHSPLIKFPGRLLIWTGETNRLPRPGD
jgi:hypothetical protein